MFLLSANEALTFPRTGDQAEISQVTSPQSQTVNSPESNAGPPAPKESTETLTQSPTRSWEDASEQDIGIWLIMLQSGSRVSFSNQSQDQSLDDSKTLHILFSKIHNLARTLQSCLRLPTRQAK